MSIAQAKQTFAEINSVRCRIIESGIPSSRMKFLKELLESNNLNVQVQQADPGDANSPFTLGVTNLLFNPILAIYEKGLKTPEGKRVTPAYWNQTTIRPGQGYWEYLFPEGALKEEPFTPWEYRSV
jgi:hypothetical protein